MQRLLAALHARHCATRIALLEVTPISFGSSACCIMPGTTHNAGYDHDLLCLSALPTCAWTFCRFAIFDSLAWLGGRPPAEGLLVGAIILALAGGCAPLTMRFYSQDRGISRTVLLAGAFGLTLVLLQPPLPIQACVQRDQALSACCITCMSTQARLMIKFCIYRKLRWGSYGKALPLLGLSCPLAPSHLTASHFCSDWHLNHRPNGMCSAVNLTMKLPCVTVTDPSTQGSATAMAHDSQ